MNLFSTECPPHCGDISVQGASPTFQVSAAHEALSLAVYLVVKLGARGWQGLTDQDVIDSCRSQHSSVRASLVTGTPTFISGLSTAPYTHSHAQGSRYPCHFLCSENDLEFLPILIAGVLGIDRHVWFSECLGLNPQLHAC